MEQIIFNTIKRKSLVLEVTNCLLLCLFLFLFTPFHSAAVEDLSKTFPNPEQVKTEAQKSVTDSPPSQSSVPAVILIRINPDEEPATLFIRNQEIITVRAEIGGLSPQNRVEQFRQRFSDAVSGSKLSEPIVKDIPPYGSMILINERPVVSIAYLDIEPLRHTTHDQVVKETVAKLSRILTEIREERSLSSMIRAIGISLLATVTLGVAIWLLYLLQKFIFRLLSTQLISTKTKGTLEQVTKLNIDRPIAIAQRVSIFLIALLVIVIFLTWLAFVLKQFPYTRPWGENVWGYIQQSMQHIGLVMVHAIPDMFTIAVIVVIARFVAKLSALVINAAAVGKIYIPGVYPETVKPTRRIIITVIYLFAMVAIYPYLPGSSSDAFKGLSVLVGLMISLGGSGVINQVMSGMMLMYTRAHQVGDYVRIGDTEGVVVALDMLATKIRTSKKEEVTIPNSVVLSTSTKNYTRLAGEDGVILHAEVSIGYSEPWRKVHEALVAAANLTTGLKKIPAPFVLQTALSDFYVAYQLNAYLEKPETRPVVLAELHSHIQDAFNEAGIIIVSPHYVADPPERAPL